MQAQALSHVNIGSVLSRIRFETPDKSEEKENVPGDHLSLNLLVANPFLQRLSGVSKQMRDRTLPIFT